MASMSGLNLLTFPLSNMKVIIVLCWKLFAVLPRLCKVWLEKKCSWNEWLELSRRMWSI